MHDKLTQEDCPRYLDEGAREMWEGVVSEVDIPKDCVAALSSYCVASSFWRIGVRMEEIVRTHHGSACWTTDELDHYELHMARKLTSLATDEMLKVRRALGLGGISCQKPQPVPPGPGSTKKGE